MALQIFSFLGDQCFRSSDTYYALSVDLAVCFNATGLRIATPTASTWYGKLIGWSDEEQAFGFAPGDLCSVNTSAGVRSYPQAAKLKIQCCSNPQLYTLSWSKPTHTPCAVMHSARHPLACYTYGMLSHTYTMDESHSVSYLTSDRLRADSKWVL